MEIEKRYFITNCNDQVVGNPKGYRTFKGANQQANGRTKLRNLLWDTFDARSNRSNNLIHSIKLYDTIKHKSIMAGNWQ